MNNLRLKNEKFGNPHKLFITVGLVLLFFVDVAPALLYVAVPCLGAGGFTLLWTGCESLFFLTCLFNFSSQPKTSNFQLSILTNIAGLVVLAIQAGFGASGTLFRVFLALEASSKSTAGILLGLTSIIWIRTLLFMPKYHIKKGQQNLLVELRPLFSHASDDTDSTPRENTLSEAEPTPGIWQTAYLIWSKTFLY